MGFDLLLYPLVISLSLLPYCYLIPRFNRNDENAKSLYCLTFRKLRRYKIAPEINPTYLSIRASPYFARGSSRVCYLIVTLHPFPLWVCYFIVTLILQR